MKRLISIVLGSLLLVQNALAIDYPQLVYCSIAAAVKYEIPANIMMAVAEKEGGEAWKFSRNKNGTIDIGTMQFNSDYLIELNKYGIRPVDVAAPGCYPYDLAAWRIRGHIKNDKGDIWTKVSNYHSRSYKENSIYRADLIVKAVKWADYIEAHKGEFNVYAVN